MNTLSLPKNPRETRAFAYAARNRANKNPTDDNVRRALEYDEMLKNGPGKSRDMGSTALKLSHEEVIEEAEQLGLVAWVNWVAFIGWATGKPGEGFINLGGGIVPRALAERVDEEIARNDRNARNNREVDELGYRYGDENQGLISELVRANRWSAGFKEGEWLARIGVIEIGDLLTRSSDALNGTEVVPPEKRPITAVRRAIIKARREQKQDQSTDKQIKKPA